MSIFQYSKLSGNLCLSACVVLYLYLALYLSLYLSVSLSLSLSFSRSLSLSLSLCVCVCVFNRVRIMPEHKHISIHLVATCLTFVVIN